MRNNSIFEQVKQFAYRDFGDSNTMMDIVYGYAKLVTMDKSVLDVLFENENDRQDIDNIVRILDENEYDALLIKQSVPFLHSNGISEADTEEFKGFIDSIETGEADYSATQILEKVFEINIPILSIMKQGHSFEDVAAYMERDNSSQKEHKSKSDKIQKKTKKDAIETVINEEKVEEENDIIEANKDAFIVLIKKTTQLYERLKCKIIGQNEAIRLFAEGYFQSEVFRENEKHNNRPSSIFLFAGPPGVGKTYLASTAAEILNLPFLRVDMSEYATKESVHKLSGVPKTYAYPKEGVLTGFVSENPRSIILLDEIEKADEEVIYQFLQILDGGVLTDEYSSKEVYFKDTILIFTTNAGKKLYESRDRKNLSALSRSIVMKEIENEKDKYGDCLLPAAICSRFMAGNVIMFNHLEIHNLISIVNSGFAENIKQVKEKYGYDLKIDDKIAPMLIYSQSANVDARNISSQATLLIKNELYEFGRHIPDGCNSICDLEEIQFKVEYDKKSEIASLFDHDDICNILFVGSKKDIKGVPFGTRCNVVISDKDSALERLSKDDISFVLIFFDTDYSTDDGYLSLDDIKSEGVLAFDVISDKLPQIPIYIVSKKTISAADKTNFYEQGVRDFVEFRDATEFADSVAKISDMIYMQKKVDDLSDKGRVLKYNTKQRFIKGGKSAEIIFYDFKTAIASDADENKLLLSDAERPKEVFDDVIGAEDAKSELKYFVEYLKNPRKYMTRSIKPPKGILLYGPPGTGKTMLARAMAGESDVTFFAATATGFMNKYIGESERNIRQLFETAKKFSPSIIFIDEIDAIGKERTGSESTHHTESMLNALLTEMDGFEVNAAKPVFVVAATNYDLDKTRSGKRTGLDAALLRRFDNRIYVDLPKEEERKSYLKQQLNRIEGNLVGDYAIDNIAKRTTGISLAVLKNIIELAVRNSNIAGVAVDDLRLMNAFEDYMYGEKHEWDEKYYKTVSIHEAGHAYICYLSGEKPSYVTIVSRGDFGGYMQHANQEKTPSYTKEQLLWKIRTALAGRAAETEFFDKEGINTGISSDLKNATEIAMNIVCSYAMMDDSLMSISPDLMVRSPWGKHFMEQVDNLLKDEMLVTRDLVSDGKHKIEKLADYLMKNNHATENDIVSIFSMEN